MATFTSTASKKPNAGTSNSSIINTSASYNKEKTSNYSPLNNANTNSYSAVYFTGYISLSYVYNGKNTVIPSDQITYVMIDDNYDEEVIPMIVLSISVTQGLYKNITNHQDKGKFSLTIKSSNPLVGNSLSNCMVSGLFNYILSNNNPDYFEALGTYTATKDTAYRRILIGMVSDEITSFERRAFNNIYKSITLNSLISLGMNSFAKKTKKKKSNGKSATRLVGQAQSSRTNWKSIIKKPKSNPKFGVMLIPPLTSRYKFFEFLFDRAPFYDTYFRYYTDFDYTYLLDRSGEAVDAKNGQLNNVIIDIQGVADQESLFDGIEKRNGAYYMYANSRNVNILLDKGTDKIANTLVSYDDDTDTKELDLLLKITSNQDEKLMFVRSKSGEAVKNQLQNGTVTVKILKPHIDGRIFTPNKAYYIKHYGDFSKYDGKYLLTEKQVFLKNTPDGFIINTILTLKSQMPIEEFMGEDNPNETENEAVPETAYRTTTANRRHLSYPTYIEEEEDVVPSNPSTYIEPEEPYYEDDDDTYVPDAINEEPDDVIDEEDETEVEPEEPTPIEKPTETPIDEEVVDPIYINSKNNTRESGDKCFGNEGHRSPDDDSNN